MRPSRLFSWRGPGAHASLPRVTLARRAPAFVAAACAAAVAAGCYGTTRRPGPAGGGGRDGGLVDADVPPRLDGGPVDAGPPPPGCEPALTPRVFEGDAFVRGPADLDALDGFDRITGDLRVVDEGVPALRLPRLERVDGAVVAVSGRVRAVSLPRLRDAGSVELGGAADIRTVDLRCLEAVDGDLLLASLTIEPFPLDRLRRVDRLLHFVRPTGERVFPALTEARVVDLAMPRFGRVAFPELARVESARLSYPSRAPIGTPPPELPVLATVEDTLAIDLPEARYDTLELPAFQAGSLVVTARAPDTIEGVSVERITAPTAVRLPVAERLERVVLDVCAVDAPRLRSAASLQLSGRPAAPTLTTDLNECETQRADLPALVAVEGELVLGDGLETFEASRLDRVGALTLVQSSLRRFERDLRGLEGGVDVQGNPLLEAVDVVAVDGTSSVRARLNPLLETLAVRHLDPAEGLRLDVLYVEECPRVTSFSFPDLAAATTVTLIGMRDLEALALPALREVDRLTFRLLESVARFDLSALARADTVVLESLLSEAPVAFPRLATASRVVAAESRIRALGLGALEALDALSVRDNPGLRALSLPRLEAADDLEVVRNPRLPNCQCEALVEQASPGTALCADNDPDGVCD